MPQTEPTVAVNVRVTVDLATALDKHCEAETAATGNPVTRADVVRLALAQYLGTATRRNGTPQQEATAPATT